MLEIKPGTEIKSTITLGAVEPKAKTHTGLVCLQFTRTLTQKGVDDCADDRYLAGLYQQFEKGTAIQKTVISIINSILFQKRIYFAMTRGTLSKLVSEDKNWKKLKLSSDNYNKIIDLMLKEGLVEELKYERNSNRMPKAFQVVHPDLLRFLKTDKDIQQNEILAYALRGSRKPHLVNSVASQDDSNDEPIPTLSVRPLVVDKYGEQIPTPCIKQKFLVNVDVKFDNNSRIRQLIGK